MHFTCKSSVLWNLDELGEFVVVCLTDGNPNIRAGAVLARSGLF